MPKCAGAKAQQSEQGVVGFAHLPVNKLLDERVVLAQVTWRKDGLIRGTQGGWMGRGGAEKLSLSCGSHIPFGKGHTFSE